MHIKAYHQLIKNTLFVLEFMKQLTKEFLKKYHVEFIVLYDGEEIKNDFSKEIDLHIIKLSKEHIINIIENSYDDNLIEKWEFIMQVFEDYEPKDNLYFIYD